ncbi:hypothetical protein [Clostridium manihotivorum]|nr:hypothetical protein [Clostridium manihotivorum]
MNKQYSVELKLKIINKGEMTVKVENKSKELKLKTSIVKDYENIDK